MNIYGSNWANPSECSNIYLNGVFHKELQEHFLSGSDLKQRYLKVLEHQDQLRKTSGLAKISHDLIDHNWIPRDRYFKTTGFHNKLFVDQGRWEQFFSINNIIVKATWEDSESLNHVYEFSDSNKLISIKTLSNYLLDNHLKEKITLTRQLSKEEAKLWKKKDLNTLVHNGSYFRYTNPVFHFHLGEKSWIGNQDSSISLSIPKSKVIEWSQKGYIDSGATVMNHDNENFFEFEVVIQSPVWEELLEYY